MKRDPGAARNPSVTTSHTSPPTAERLCSRPLSPADKNPDDGGMLRRAFFHLLFILSKDGAEIQCPGTPRQPVG